MRACRTISWVVLCLSFTIYKSLASSPLHGTSLNDSSHFIPKRYIVELDSLDSLPGKRHYTGRTAHEDVYHHMRKRGIDFNVHHEFNSRDVFVGASINVESPHNVARILEIRGVKTIRQVTRISRSQALNTLSVTNATDSQLSTKDTHAMMGVDKLHAQGIMGQGVKIGIIDSGIDFTHPALGGAIGEGHKIIGGYDFSGDDFDGSNTAVPDGDPRDTCHNHGTQVAGIIAADPGSESEMRGVAPQARIAAYRVFGCKSEFTSDDVVIAAMMRARDDGMNILSLSIGLDVGWAESAAAVVASRIARSGLVVVVAASNGGRQGAWYTATPAVGMDVISVGSANNAVVPGHYASIIGAQYPPLLYPGSSPINAIGNMPVYAISHVFNDSSCQALPDDIIDLSGHVVLLAMKDGCIGTQMKAVTTKGAKVVLIYRLDEGSMKALDFGSVARRVISATDGKFLVEKLAAGVALKINFQNIDGTGYISDIDRGLVSWFSSYGPSFGMHMTPSLIAPGTSILSTVREWEYGFSDGTSMSAPFVAGAAALVLQARGKSVDAVLHMRDILQSTSSSVRSGRKEDALLQTVAAQGAGLIRVDLAATAKTLVFPAQLLLNDSSHFVPSHEITVKNTGSASILYELSHVPAGTALTTQPIYPVELIDAPASVTISPSRFILAPGSARVVTLRFEAPVDTPEKRLPVFSGYVKIASPAEALHVTYLGAVGSLKTQTVIDASEGQAPLLGTLTADGRSVVPVDTEKAITFTINSSNSTWPCIQFRMLFGSPLVLFELTRASTDAPTIGLIEERLYMPRSPSPTVPDPHNHRFNPVIFGGKLANGTRVSNGQYRIRMRALKVTGDRNNPADYESWLSPSFLLNYTAS